jgi:Phage gp6-like head-tail connector protein
MYDLTTAKLRLGIDPSDLSKDSLITLSMDAALQFAENYCDRKFMFQPDNESFVHVKANTLSLRRYPLSAVTQVTLEGNILNPSLYYFISRHEDKRAGLLFFDAALFVHEIVVAYEGGYQVLPADLEMVLWKLFDWAWGNLSPSTGSSSVQSVGAVKALTIPDVGRVEFASSGDSTFGGGASSSPYLPIEFLGSQAAILDFYRRWLA